MNSRLATLAIILVALAILAHTFFPRWTVYQDADGNTVGFDHWTGRYDNCYKGEECT
jgi:hypothetical protein